MHNYFPTIIGQEPVKRKLGFYIEGYWSTDVFPNTILFAAKGLGKTRVAKQTSGVLNTYAKQKNGTIKYYEEVNCATIRDPNTFIPKFMELLAVHSTVFFDEIHAMHPDVVDWMLTALNPEQLERKVSFGNRTATLDARRTTILAATTERQKVFAALLNRFQVVELNQYSDGEMAQIIAQNVSTCKIDGDILAHLSTLTRGNARSAVDLAMDVERYLKTRNVSSFDAANATELVTLLDLFPLGLTRAEVSLMQTISDRDGVTVTSLCAETGLTRPAQQQFETYLLRRGLIEIDTNSHRKVTGAGTAYLRDLTPL